jgi:hypothetical protein
MPGIVGVSAIEVQALLVAVKCRQNPTQEAYLRRDHRRIDSTIAASRSTHSSVKNALAFSRAVSAVRRAKLGFDARR